MSQPVTMCIVGAGDRGLGYTHYASAYPEELKIVAVADPVEYRRNVIGNAHAIPSEHRFNSWQDFVGHPKMCDAVAICTQDAMHEEATIACAKLGYHILLEKPMAPTASACRRIAAAVKESGVLFSVCHVLRYTKFSKMLREIVRSGEIGDIVSVQHLESVGYWHQAHSFVRGKWRNEQESSFMLLAKCCHDVDWLQDIIGKKCVQVQSFGNLRHLKASEKPAGAADRCCECPVEVESFCPFSALKIYFRDRLALGNAKWPVNVLTANPTPETLRDALKKGPYGRCVYACDNDVVDNQVVNFLFEDGTTAAMTMTAFNFLVGRKTRIFGTRGEIDTDSRKITIKKFIDDSVRTVDTEIENSGSIIGGHGGGDFGLMESFVKAVSAGDQGLILSGIDETLNSHLTVFAAEESRRQATVCTVG